MYLPEHALLVRTFFVRFIVVASEDALVFPEAFPVAHSSVKPTCVRKLVSWHIEHNPAIKVVNLLKY